MKRPTLSIVVVLFNMRREAERTLHSLNVSYEEDVGGSDYDVHVVENGSSEPVDEAFVRSIGPNFHGLVNENLILEELHLRDAALARGAGV